ncbi:hypothetical protein ENSA5_58090 [Enhygromyxa salina]|uniref:Tetratricopeptide repeat protein n=1 Tax=Enhygromyxa salina TaxID=215803 RepID=A0A2S9XE59_9BACT|nr:tetratricopeptide repeat protein [Enhygromyxa salina]PRP91149.1 hypothetical protein ENSA5_58090 [Enhygromyxa salina]
MLVRAGLVAHTLIASAALACSGEGPPGSSKVAPDPAPAQAKVEAKTKVEAEAEARPAMSGQTSARATELGTRFRDAKGKPSCDVEALAELRELRERFGPASPLREVLLAAFSACDERVALAQLHAETLPATPSAQQRLELGAAWLRASRYEDAAEILVPLAGELGPTTKAAWLAGFSLVHAGRPGEALPWLEGARAHAGGEQGSDGALLVGLAKLDTGDLDGAIATLEAGVAASPTNRSLLAALARAYASAGRGDDAARVSEQARAAFEHAAKSERQMTRLAALSSSLSEAWDAGRYAEVEQFIDAMWADAPPELREQLLSARVALYERTDRPADAAAARDALAQLRGQ